MDYDRYPPRRRARRRPNPSFPGRPRGRPPGVRAPRPAQPRGRPPGVRSPRTTQPPRPRRPATAPSRRAPTKPPPRQRRIRQPRQTATAAFPAGTRGVAAYVHNPETRRVGRYGLVLAFNRRLSEAQAFQIAVAARPDLARMPYEQSVAFWAYRVLRSKTYKIITPKPATETQIVVYYGNLRGAENAYRRAKVNLRALGINIKMAGIWERQPRSLEDY